MNEDQIRQIVQDEIQKQKLKLSGFSDTSFHTHSGIDSQQLDPNLALLGFPIRTANPTDAAINGKIVLSDVAGTRRIWAKVNGTWYSTTIT